MISPIPTDWPEDELPYLQEESSEVLDEESQLLIVQNIKTNLPFLLLLPSARHLQIPEIKFEDGEGSPAAALTYPPTIFVDPKDVLWFTHDNEWPDAAIVSAWWQAIAAHELRHLEPTNDAMWQGGDHWGCELDCDYFAGVIYREIELAHPNPIPSHLEIAKLFESFEEDDDHPPGFQRADAFIRGYKSR